MRQFFILFIVATGLVLGASADAATYEDGLALYRAGDYDGAMAVWLPLAEAGDRDSQYRYGGMYRDGKGVPQDNAIAVEWFVKAAVQGQIEAQNTLGFMFDMGDGLPKDRDKAKCLYHLAAEQGNPLAQNNLASLLEPGERPRGNFYWRKRAARQGDTAAMANTGFVLWQNPYEKNKTKAYMYLILAERGGDTRAINDLRWIRGNADSKALRELAAAEDRAENWEPQYETPPDPPPPVPKRCLP